MNTILRIAGPEDGGSSPPAPPPPKPTIASLVAENEQLKATIATQIATIANLTAAKAEADADEKLVLAKADALKKEIAAKEAAMATNKN